MLQNKGIVITTSEYTKDFLKPLLNSLIGVKYPILVVSNGGYVPEILPKHDAGMKVVFNNWNGFELGGIVRGKEEFDEFVHFMDSCLVKDVSLIDKLFAKEGHVFLTNGGYHYMGKFVSKDLPVIEKINNKDTAIALELRWLKGKTFSYFEPDLPVHTQVFEEKFGNRRMKLENDYLIKWKGTFFC